MPALKLALADCHPAGPARECAKSRGIGPFTAWCGVSASHIGLFGPRIRPVSLRAYFWRLVFRFDECWSRRRKPCGLKRGPSRVPPGGTERAGLRWQKSGTLRRRISEMKQVMALVLGVALVGASAATTSAQTGTGTGTKSTTTTTRPTTSPTTAPTTTKKTTTVDCPGKAEKSKGKATTHNPNCR